MTGKKHQKRQPQLYSVVGWLGPEGNSGMPDVWLVLATYAEQAKNKIKTYYAKEDWPGLRSMRARRVLSSDMQRIL